MVRMIPSSYTDSRTSRNRKQLLTELKDVKGNYPPGTDFSYGSELHDRILLMVNNCAQAGMSATDSNITEYDKIDKSLDLYMEPSEIDRRRSGRDARKPVNVVMSQQMANSDLFKTAMARTFFSGPYVHRFKGQGSPERSAKGLVSTKVVQWVVDQFRHRRSLDILFGDSFNYGRGWAWGKWSKETAPAYEITQVDELMSSVLKGMGGDYKAGEMVRHLSDEVEVTKEGTKWVNIDPRQILADPTVTPDDFQDSEFFGWATRTDALKLVGMEDDPEEAMFNCRGLETLCRIQPRSRFYRDTNNLSPRLQSGEEQWKGRDESSSIDLVYMMCRIIPSDWGLGDGKKPQLWFFCVAGDMLVIKAHQIRARHGQYPVICAAPNARGHQIAPVSHLMATLGAAHAVDFHIKRRHDFLDTAHNGKYALDPTKVEYTDVRDADGPMVVRLKKSAFGTGRIEDWFKQLDTQDVTAGTWNDVAAITQMDRNLSGLQEVLTGGGLPSDPTATGVDAMQGGALSRLVRTSMVLDEQVMRPKAYQDICNVSQYMGGEIIIGIEGREEEVIRSWYALPEGATGLSVDRFDIDPELDVIPMSNASQGTKSFAAMTEFAKALIGPMLAQPGVAQSMMPFVSQYMREIGVDDYDWINVQVLPDAAMMQQAQAGNLAPMGMPQKAGVTA